jgi:hypothetical protein
MLLAAVLVLLAACGGAATPESVAPTQPAATLAAETEATAATESEPAEEPAEPASTADPSDPTQVRDRDWKLNEVEDPAVTVIEYGDFQ